MTTIPELRENVRQKQREFQDAKDALREALIADCPVKVGDLVRHYRNPWVGRVVHLDPNPWGGGGYHVTVNRQLKDGTFGTAKHYWMDNWRPL